MNGSTGPVAPGPTDSATLPTLETLKAQAKRLRAGLAVEGNEIGHGKALELLARQHGYRDWNTLHAALGNRPATLPLALGSRVSGHYLGQAFEGEVIALRSLGDGARVQLTLQFDQPVDVVSFDSFSAFRSRVTCSVGRDGRSAERTSDGRPHMALRL